MKTFLITILAVCAAINAWADGTPTTPATQTEVNAGVIHNKFVAPDTLKAAIAGSTATNVTTTLRAIRFPLVVGSPSGAGIYDGQNDGPAPWYPRDWIKWNAVAGIGVYFPDLNTTTNLRARCTITILNTNTVPVAIAGLDGAILYFHNTGRAYIQQIFAGATLAPLGYTTLTWTNTFTNTTLTRSIGFESGNPGNPTQILYITRFTTQPLP